MPKPIKKRIQKKDITEKEVVTIYKQCKNYYEKNRRFVHLIAATILLIILGITFSIYYNKSLSSQAAVLEYEGYKLYHNLYQQDGLDEKDALNKALRKFQDAFDKKSSPIRLLHIANTQYRLSKNKEALKTLRKFVEKYSNNREFIPIAYYRIATIQLKDGKKEDALKTLETLYSLKVSTLFKDLALFETAKILEGLDRKGEAIKRYKLLAQNYPESPYAKIALSKIEKEEVPEEGKEEKEASQKGKAVANSEKEDK